MPVEELPAYPGKKSRTISDEQLAHRVIGFDNYYVSPRGRVWSAKTGRWLKPTIKSGSTSIQLVTNRGVTVRRQIARLVLETHVEDTCYRQKIGYRDGNPGNVDLENLFWA